MDDNTKEFILDTKITDEHGRGWDKSPYRYNPYLGTPLSTILDTYIMAQKNWYLLIKTAWETTSTDKYTIFSSSKPLRTWLGIKSAPSLPLST